MSRRNERVLAAALLASLLGFAYIGRAVISSDGGEMLTDTLGLLADGRFAAPRLADGAPDRSKYGLFPSLLLLPLTGAAWPARESLGGAGLDAIIAFTWAGGALAAALGFLRLARSIRPGLSPLWAPAFLAGTFLWPYAADSYVEPWAAAALSLGGAFVLERSGATDGRRGAAAGLLWGAACLLRPMLWATTPVVVLAALLASGSSKRPLRLAASVAAALSAIFAMAVLTNISRTGSALDVGYGAEASAFTNPLLSGLFGLTLGPCRGLVWYAPVVFAALAGLGRIPAAARALVLGTTSIQLIVSAQWWAWHGSSAWGPRLLLPILPFLVVPATLRPRLAAVLLAIGAFVNLQGVLVAPGSWISRAERLPVPPGATWPNAGPDRVSVIPGLSPLAGPYRLLSSSVPPAEYVSPWWLRTVLRLPPIHPMTPRLLVRIGAAYHARGDLRRAQRYGQEALRLAPGDLDARLLSSLVVPSP